MARLPNAAFRLILASINSDRYATFDVGGESVLIDADMLPVVKELFWYIKGDPYPTAVIGRRHIPLHRLIMGKMDGREVDHKNGDPLDNRRTNLRFATKTQNAANRHKVAGRSKFKGVRRDRGMWRAAIKKDGVRTELGIFPTERLAARAYDKAAIAMYGEFAKTNHSLGLY